MTSPASARVAAPRRANGRATAGLALVTVIVVLAALAMVAVPFALSMRNLDSAARVGFRQAQVRADAELALAAARRALEGTHPELDLDTPHHDGMAEVTAPGLRQRFPELLPADPRGVLADVSSEDEQGKVDLTRATPALLGNLLGGRTLLTAGVRAGDSVLPVASTAGLPPSGLLMLGREQVEWSRLGRQSVEDLRRGVASANLERSVAADHPAGTEVLDSRLLLLVQRAWLVAPGSFQAFQRVDGIKEIALVSELAYDAATVDRVAGSVTVHGGPLRWRTPQRVLGSRALSSGGAELFVPDGSRFGPGTVVALRDGDGATQYDLVLAASAEAARWRLTLLEGPRGALAAGTARVSALAPVPVNACTASEEVLTALLTGLGRQPVDDVIGDEEAVHLALLLQAAPPGTTEEEWPAIARTGLEAGEFSRADLGLALAFLEQERVRPEEFTPGELALVLAGRTSLRDRQVLSRTAAAELARRIRASQPASHEDLRALLALAVQEGVLLPTQAEVVLLNAVDSRDARITGATAPFCYASDGVFTLRAAASRNLPNGREVARSRLAEIVAPAPAGPVARLLLTQADFEAAGERGSGGTGWVSFPRLLHSGAGGAPGPVPGEVPLLDLRTALARAGQPVDRAGTLLGGRPGPSPEERGSFLTLDSLRSALPGTVHFDEGGPGLTGDTPAGLDLSRSPLRIAMDGTEPGLTLPRDGRLRPFTISFWFTPQDLQGETVLFDTGSGGLEDRVSILLQDGTLVLRVSDAGVPDTREHLAEGALPPAGEIRYAFDDGLALVAGVPYHVAAFVGGARSRQLLLFVDGQARGRRGLTTRLTADVEGAGGPFEGSASGQGKTRLAVESTAGFPERGALRVGEEIVEYIERGPEHFVLAAAGTQDPFGGRARRGTFGSEHKASELVELVGYSRPLQALVALQGNGSLDGALGDLGLGQLDETRLSAAINVRPMLSTGGTLAEPFELGTGLAADATTIPVRGLDGGSAAEDLFQTGGGHAIVFCDYGNTALVGQTISAETGTGQWTIPFMDENGAWIGGGEVVRYDGWSGGTLTGVRRADQGLPVATGEGGESSLDGASQNWVGNATTSWNDARVFVTSFADHLLSELSLPDPPRVLVIPISVAVSDSLDLWEGYHSGLVGRSHLLQVGLDFPEGGGGSEWLRFDTVTADAFVRDDLGAVRQLLDELSVNGMDAWRTTTAFSEDTLEGLNERLDFRGQGGTPSTTHPGGEQCLPVIPFGGFGIEEYDAAGGIPGRHDFVTLLGPGGEREWNEINHASTLDAEWSGTCLVGLRAPVLTELLASEPGEDETWLTDEIDLEAALAEGGAGARLVETLGLANTDELLAAVHRFQVDSRLLARLVCGPSGELPALPPGALHLGEDTNRQRSPGGALVDELTFHVAGPPGPLLPPVASYRLAQELLFDEEQVLLLAVDEVSLPHAVLRSARLGKDELEVLSELPAAGGLLLVGDEIVAYAGLDPVDTGAVFLVARGLCGSSRGHHARGSPVQFLGFLPVSPLAAAVSAEGGFIPLSDASAFPAGGGLVRLGDELLAYDARDVDGLLMPLSAGRSATGLLRGRFGTVATPHPAGAMVVWMPARVADQALLGEDAPEARLARLAFRAPGAFHEELAVTADLGDPRVELVARVVLDGHGSAHRDPAEVLELAPVAGHAERFQIRVGERADVVELCLFARWLPGAFDPLGGTSNAWKLAPVVREVVLTQRQPTLVLEREEWR